MSVSSRALKLAAILAAVALCGFAAYVLLWSTYMAYDDEGYVLHSLQAFAEHGALYDQVYTQYGPFYYAMLRGLHAAGLEFTNENARWLTLICWVGAAGACAAAVARAGRCGFALTLFTLCGVFVHLWRLTSEPSHPGGFIVLAVAVACWLATEPRLGVRARYAALGGIAAMLLLTKVNIGVFFIAAVAVWSALQAGDGARGRVLHAAGEALLAALPLGLLGRSLHTPWVLAFATVTAAAGLSCVLAARAITREVDLHRGLAASVATAAAIGIASITFVLATGTSWAGLLDGVVLGPLRLPSIFSFPFPWRPGAVVLAVAGIPAAWWLSRCSPEPRFWILALARGVAAVAWMTCATGRFSTGSPGFALSYGVGTAWLFVMPLRRDEPVAPLRALLGLMLVAQSLHAFPVPGSQVSWGTFLWIPLAGAGLHEVVLHIASRPFRLAAAVVLACAPLAVTADYVAIGARRFDHSIALNLPGAEDLRLAESQATALRMLTRNAAAHGDVLFSLTGMLSFHRWSGVPAPTLANATHWFSLLSPAQQNQIRLRLEGEPRSVVIVQRHVYDLLKQERIVIEENPLLRWLHENYTPVFSVQSYEFWVRKGRHVLPLNSARVFEGGPGAATRYRIEVIAEFTRGTRIAACELRELHDETARPLHAWTPRNALMLATSINAAGQPLAATTSLADAPELQGLVRLEIYTDTLPRFSVPAGGLVFYEGSGIRAGEARFIP